MLAMDFMPFRPSFTTSVFSYFDPMSKTISSYYYAAGESSSCCGGGGRIRARRLEA
jgi:hypothetical protein